MTQDTQTPQQPQWEDWQEAITIRGIYRKRPTPHGSYAFDVEYMTADFANAQQQRIVALEAALREYGGHTASCYVGAKVCRCGLDALLSPSEAK